MGQKYSAVRKACKPVLLKMNPFKESDHEAKNLEMIHFGFKQLRGYRQCCRGAGAERNFRNQSSLFGKLKVYDQL